MTYSRQENNNKLKSPQERTNTTKKYLTNSDKSVFNLKWEVGGIAEENYRKSRVRSQSQSVSESKTPRSHSYKHYHEQPASTTDEVPLAKVTPRSHSYKHYHEQPASTTDEIPLATVTPEAHEQPIVYYYPYAYPPLPVSQSTQSVVKTQSKKTTRTKGKLTQSQKSLNLASERSKLKVEHHFVDSPHQAKKLIDELRRKGFIEAGIETSGVDLNRKKK